MRNHLGDIITLPSEQYPTTEPWIRQALLPDSVLPPALQRSNT